ncbi:hypothetical protein AB205_0093520 [Aquarana catesbeiana]|uniref:Septin-type G domain-containing protein n=1 Tax=Aquarana catesbeiana TaxID=8400 RepID=A0A2G9RZV3_AQUCT|nr:hypothetical protein AB205_0093520 [Aquarana catesbeiana]
MLLYFKQLNHVLIVSACNVTVSVCKNDMNSVGDCFVSFTILFLPSFTVENGEHCDFTILRNMLIRTHMQDLKDVTNNVHYENYRSRKLAAVTYNGVDNNKNKGQLTKLDTVEGM